MSQQLGNIGRDDIILEPTQFVPRLGQQNKKRDRSRGDFLKWKREQNAQQQEEIRKQMQQKTAYDRARENLTKDETVYNPRQEILPREKEETRFVTRQFGSYMPVTQHQDSRYNKPRVTTVTIDSSDRNEEVYPEPNHYKIQLNKELQQIKSIKLATTEIPNTAQVLYKRTESDGSVSHNTSIYWVDYDDVEQGNYDIIYEARLDPGNYTAISLAQHMQERMNGVNRFITGTPHEFIVSIDLDTDVAEWMSISSTVLGTNPIQTNAGSGLVTVTHEGHNFRIGDFVVIVGASAVGAITAERLNTTHEIITVTENSYDILLSTISPETVSGGGSSVKSGIEKEFSFLFSNKNTPYYPLGFPQQDSSELLSCPIEFIDTAPPDLDQPDATPRTEHPAGTAPAWFLSTGHDLQPGDRVKIRDTDCIPDVNGIQVVTNVPDGSSDPDDVHYFEIGKSAQSLGTDIQVVNKQTIYENETLGQAIESFDTVHRYITNISTATDHYFQAASPHGLLNFSNVYIAYTSLNPDVNGPNGIANTIFNPPDDTKFTIDTDVTGNLANTTNQEFVEITTNNAYNISRIIRANNGTLALNTTAFAGLKEETTDPTEYWIYIGMPDDPAKTIWATPDMNSFTTNEIHQIRSTNFPGTVGGVIQQFQSPNTIELETVITDVLGVPTDDREIVLVKDTAPHKILNIIDISIANTGFVTFVSQLQDIPNWNPSIPNNVVFIANASEYADPDSMNGTHIDAIEPSTAQNVTARTTTNPTTVTVPGHTFVGGESIRIYGDVDIPDGAYTVAGVVGDNFDIAYDNSSGGVIAPFGSVYFGGTQFQLSSFSGVTSVSPVGPYSPNALAAFVTGVDTSDQFVDAVYAQNSGLIRDTSHTLLTNYRFCCDSSTYTTTSNSALTFIDSLQIISATAGPTPTCTTNVDHMLSVGDELSNITGVATPRTITSVPTPTTFVVDGVVAGIFPKSFQRSVNHTSHIVHDLFGTQDSFQPNYETIDDTPDLKVGTISVTSLSYPNAIVQMNADNVDLHVGQTVIMKDAAPIGILPDYYYDVVQVPTSTPNPITPAQTFQIQLPEKLGGTIQQINNDGGNVRITLDTSVNFVPNMFIRITGSITYPVLNGLWPVSAAAAPSGQEFTIPVAWVGGPSPQIADGQVYYTIYSSSIPFANSGNMRSLGRYGRIHDEIIPSGAANSTDGVNNGRFGQIGHVIDKGVGVARVTLTPIPTNQLTGFSVGVQKIYFSNIVDNLAAVPNVRQLLETDNNGLHTLANTPNYSESAILAATLTNPLTIQVSTAFYNDLIVGQRIRIVDSSVPNDNYYDISALLPGDIVEVSADNTGGAIVTSPVVPTPFVYTGHLDVIVNNNGDFTPRISHSGGSDEPIASFVLMHSSVTDWNVPTSIIPYSVGIGHALRINSHNFGANNPAPPGDTPIYNTMITNVDSVAGWSNPTDGATYGAQFSPLARFTFRDTTQIEIMDQDFIRFTAPLGNVIIPTFVSGTNYRLSGDSTFTDGLLRYTRTTDPEPYPIDNLSVSSTGIITTDVPHGINVLGDNVYIEGPDVDTVPAGGIQGLRNADYISPTEFEVNLTDPGNPDIEITSVTSSSGRVVVVNPIQGNSVYTVTSAARASTGQITTSLDLTLATPPIGGIGYPSSFDIYVANANVVTSPAIPSPAGPTGESLRNLVWRTWRYGDTLSGTSDTIFEPNLLITDTALTNPIEITTISPHGFSPGDNVQISGDSSPGLPDGSYVVDTTPTSTSITLVGVDNTGGTNVTPHGIISPDPVEPFFIESVPNPPTFPTTVQWANADVSIQPILITDVVPSLNGLLELDNAVGVVPNDNVYIEGTNTTPNTNGIQNVLNVYGSEIELRDIDITAFEPLKSATVGISYQNITTGNVIFDISATPQVTYLLGEPVTISGHTVASYNASGLTVVDTTPGSTIEVSGLAWNGNGTGGTVTADTYGRLIRTPSAAVASVTDITEGVVPAVFTAPAHGFSTGIIYFIGTKTTPRLDDAPDYGIRNDATIVDADTFSIPEALEVENRTVVLANRDSLYTKQVLRTQTGRIWSMTRDIPNNRTIIETRTRTNPNRVSFAITSSEAGTPGLVNAPGHTFSDGDMVEIVGHKSLPALSGPYVISGVVPGVSFLLPVRIVLGSDIQSGFAVGPAEDYIGHGLRSLSGSLGRVPFAISRIYHTNPARVMLQDQRTLFCGEELLVYDNAALPSSDTYPVTRIFELDGVSGREFLIPFDATLSTSIVSLTAGNPTTVVVDLPQNIVSGASIAVGSDSNLPDGDYVISSIGSNAITGQTIANPTEITTGVAHGFLQGQNVTISSGNPDVPAGTYAVTPTGATTFTIAFDNTVGSGVGGGVVYTPNVFELPYDNSSGTNVAPYGYVYIGNTRYEITNVTQANPTEVTIRSQSFSVGNQIVVDGDNNIPDGTYAVQSVLSLSSYLLSVETTTDVAPFGVVSPYYTEGGFVERSPIQIYNPYILTSEDHGLYDGYEITITGSDSVPSADGTFRIMRVDEHTFTVDNIGQTNTVAGETGSWIWGNQIVLHNVTTNPDITDIIWNVEVLSDTTFAIPYAFESDNDVPGTDVPTTAYWGTNVVTVQYKNHGLASGDVISVYLAEKVGGIAAATVNTVHGEKTKNVPTTKEILSKKTVTVADWVDDRVGSPTFGQVIPNPNEFQIFADGSHLLFRDKYQTNTGLVLSIANDANNRSIVKQKSPNRLLDAFAKSSVVGGGYDLCLHFIGHNKLEVITQGLRNYGFRSIQNNISCNGSLNRVISLEGDNYIYLVSSLLSTVATSGEVEDVFAKILLSDPPGSLLFNTFLSNGKYFDITPLPKLAELEFRFVDKDGRLFDFNGVDHSFSLEVEEYVDVLTHTQISDRRGIDDRQTTKSFGTSFASNLSSVGKGMRGTRYLA